MAAGAYGSPQLLMLSGVGPAAHLREHGLEVVVDNANVGAAPSGASDGLPELAGHRRHARRRGRAQVSGPVARRAARGSCRRTSPRRPCTGAAIPACPRPTSSCSRRPCYFWEHGFRKTSDARVHDRRGIPRPAKSRRGARCARPTRRTTRGSSTTRSRPMARSTRCCARSSSCREIASQAPLRRMLGEELNPSAQIKRPRAADRLAAGDVRARVPPELHMPDRLAGGGRRGRRAARARDRGAASRRRERAAAHRLGQHAVGHADDRRALLGPGPRADRAHRRPRRQPRPSPDGRGSTDRVHSSSMSSGQGRGKRSRYGRASSTTRANDGRAASAR